MTPAWFEKGKPIDPADYDVLEFLENDELDLEWRLCEIPRDELLQLPGMREDWESFLASGPLPLAEKMQRCIDIMTWISHSGGTKKALLESPPVLTWSEGRFDLVDGHHRLGIALHLSTMGKHLSDVPCIVALK